MGLVIMPIGDKVVIKPLEQDRSFADGKLLLPENVDTAPQRGIVVGVGTGRITPHAFYPLEVEAGDMVLFSKYAGFKISLNNEDLLVMREEDIFCTLMDEDEYNQLIAEDMDMEEVNPSMNDPQAIVQ
jgi:chaperonin GroES